MKPIFNRLLSGVLSVAMTVSAMPVVSAHAEETAELYPYAMFAASNADGAITVNAGNFCVNGNIATNGTIVTSGNMNINGTKTEHADESMIYILKKLNNTYFSSDDVDTYTEDFVLEDINININDPIDVDGTIELTGNINLNSGIKAVDDITINGEVKNANNAIICSEMGDIYINTSNVSFTGLIYAPYGDIVIDSDNLNLNNVVIIGQTITIDSINVNANYSRETAALVGIESDVDDDLDIELYAMGDYNDDANAIDIEWFTDYTDSCSYKVLCSDDNKNYSSIATVSDDTSYQYLITEDFEKRYFKISLVTELGQKVESIPFVVTKTEDGYEVSFLDSDEDGLSDVYEIMYSTAVNKPDTDEDGLTDYQEIYNTNTDPVVWDSVQAGISDAETDVDSDGLSNIDEIVLGTDPLKADSDKDHFSDGDEVAYGTDPLNPDTDGDSILDGDEEALGFDPLEYDTDKNGVSDGDEYVKQTVNEDRYDPKLFKDNLAVPTLNEVTAKGNVNSNIKISEYKGDLQGEERSYVGKVIEISKSDISAGKLTFTLSDAYSIKEYELFGEKSNGLVICYNDGEDTIPLDTTFDAESRTLSADITAKGYYFVLDVVDWINSLGIDMNDYVVEPEDSTRMLMAKAPATIASAVLVAASTTAIADIKIKGQVDIVFVIDTTGSMGSYINNVKSNLQSFVDDIEKAGIKPNFALVKYEDITHDGVDSTQVKKNGTSNWFMDADKFKNAISALKLGDGGDWPETAIDGLEVAHQLDMRNSAQKFIILVTDANYKVDNNYGIKSMSELASSLKKDNISTSVVTDTRYKETYRELYETTDGIIANINGNFKNELLKISDKINEETNSGYWIALKGLIPQIVKLDEKPSASGTADSDGDSLLDRKELKSVIPTGYFELNDYIKILYNIDIDDVQIPIYDYYSNPTKVDTDNDGIDDYDETNGYSYTSPNGTSKVYDGDPRHKGLADGVVGTLTIVSDNSSQAKFWDGHAFLLYESFINDTLDFSGFARGFKFTEDGDGTIKNNWNETPVGDYKISPNRIVSIGNYSSGDDGWADISGSSGSGSSGSSGSSSSGSSSSGSSSSGSSSSGSGSSTGEGNGIHFNMELRLLYSSEDGTEDGAYVRSYGNNAALTHDITSDQLETMLEYENTVDHYNFVGNNCAEIAGKSWNTAFDDDLDYRIWTSTPTPAALKKAIKKRDGDFKISFHDDEWKNYINKEVVDW